MHFTGIDLHKHIFTACVLDENEKVIDEMIDVPTTEKGLESFMERHPPESCLVLFENLTRAHFAYHFLREHGYHVDVAHTGHGAIGEICNTSLKTDRVDAYKLALLCKDLWTGRRFIRKSHISSDENMRMKALIRNCNECGNIRDEMDLRIQEYMNLHNIPPHPRYKDVQGIRYRDYLLGLKDPTLTMMVNIMTAAIKEIDAAKTVIADYVERSEDAKLLKTIKGISDLTAATIVTAIDGIHRFDSPEKLVSYFGLAVSVKESAGTRKKGCITKEGDPLVRKYMANVVVKHAIWCPDSDLAKFYRSKSDTMAHWKAVTAAMRKLTCIIWAMLSHQTPYRHHPTSKSA